MNTGINYTALAVLIGLFLLVTVMGFWASNWRKAESLASLDEWGLGGRKFGTWVTWFLLGGDIYTAYTFVAVPAAMFALGAVNGFFAVPYTIILYPIIFVFMARLWSVSYSHGYVTAADFVRGRYGSRELSLAVAITGILATMPYIALQLVGIQAVLEVVGLGGSGSVIAKDLPLFIAFALLAAYTYSAGLRAPAVIAFVKDGLIYLVILVAIVYLPSTVGGWAHIFAAAEAKMTAINPATGRPVGTFIPAPQYGPTRRWRVGSALALFMFAFDYGDALVAEPQHDSPQRDHPACAQFRARSRLLGWVAIAAAQADRPRRPAQCAARDPQLFETLSAWFAASLCGGGDRRASPGRDHVDRGGQHFTRNIYREWIHPHATHAQEANVSKIVSLLVKGFALVFVLTLDKQNAINFQLLGGIWILQTFPAIVFGLYTPWFHQWGLLAGWAAGMAYGTVTAYNVINPATGNHFAGSLSIIPVIGQLGYIALTAFALNALISVVVTFVMNAAGVPRGHDETRTGDYFADEGDPRVEKHRKMAVGPGVVLP